MNLKEFGNRKVVVKSEEGEFTVIVEDGQLSFHTGALKERTGTILMPSSLVRNPSKLKAVWYLLTGKIKAYCHLYGCPKAGEDDRCPVLQLRRCKKCGYTFKHALKLLDLLKRMEE